MAKPTALKFTGTMVPAAWDDKGKPVAYEPDRFFMGVPARDLDEDDIAKLDAATLKQITGGANPLYVDVAAKEPSRDAEKPAEATRAR